MPRHQDTAEKHGLFRLSTASNDGDQGGVDIVAIHGLGGHAFKTWTDSDGHLWLRDSLPSHVPEANILTYGYDSAFLFGKSKMRIHDFAIDLLSRLRIEQQMTPGKERRLIFICHSLGGLVLKQALITASLRSDQYGSILKNTYGVVFMGTPHQGSRSANLGRHLSRIVNITTFGAGVRSELLEDLEISSATLEQLSLLSVSLLEKLAIVSFYEQKPLGPSMIVEPFSAIIGVPNERSIPINADHRRIACVSPRSEHQYLPVWKTIAELVTGELPSFFRFESCGKIESENCDWAPLYSLTGMLIDYDVGWDLSIGFWIAGWPIDFMPGCLASAPSESKDLLDALYCADYKRSQLRPRMPHTTTCDWLYEDPAFNSWAKCNISSLLWLSGPAGAGKSVLTRHLLDGVLAGDPIVPLDPGYLVISFFCSYHDAAFSSEEVVLRSLLHQLLQINPNCQGIIYNRLMVRTRNGVTWNLSREYLWVALEQALALDSMRQCLIVLDAIEELPTETAMNLLAGLYNISTRFNTEHRNHRIRTFVSSRHKVTYTSILDSPFSVFFIRLRGSLLKRSIETFIKENIEELASKDIDFSDSAGPQERREIVDKIVLRADGMFLWATIAWDDFKRGKVWSEDIVRKKIVGLDAIPNGINALYDRLISQVQPATRKVMWTLFSVLSVSARPLYQSEIETVLSIKGWKGRLVNSTDLAPIEDLKEMIETEFADMVIFHEDNSITFTHLSFKEYLFQYWTEKNPEWLEKARCSMAEACLTYLDLRDLVRDAQTASSPEKFALQYPFFRYAFDFYLHHLSNIPFENETWLQFADLGSAESIFTAPWIRNWKHINWATSWSIAYASPLLAAIFQFESQDLVSAFARHGYDLNENWQRDSNARTPLNFCCAGADTRKMEAMASLLLNLGADPNDPDEKAATTCLQHCLERKAKDLFEKLLRHPKINLNIRNTLGRAILHSVVQNGDHNMLTGLLSNGDIDINIQDALGYTPLHLATMSRKLSTMRGLLQAYGIRLDLTDRQGRTPLTVATFWGFKDAAVVLIDHSQAFPTPERDQLSSLVCAAKQGDIGLTRILLGKYRYTNLNYHMDLSGKGVLHHAAANDWPDMLEECLSRHDENTNVNQIDHSGGTALHSAASFGNTNSCQVLLKYGASLRLQDRNGRTAAHAAADAGFKDTLMCLLKGDDLDVNQRDHQGRNLIHWAATLDCVDVMRIVTQKLEAELFRKDNMSLMPIDIAFICQCPNVGRFLSEEMLSRRGTKYMTYIDTFHWNSMYCSPIVSSNSNYYEIEEQDLLTREHHRRQQNEAAWQAVRKQYPEHLWALVVPSKLGPKTSPDAPPPTPPPARNQAKQEEMQGTEEDYSYFCNERPTSYETPKRYQTSYPNPVNEPSSQIPRRPVPTGTSRYTSYGQADPSRTSSRSYGDPEMSSTPRRHPSEPYDYLPRQSSGASRSTNTSGYSSPTYADQKESRETKNPEYSWNGTPPPPGGTAGQNPEGPVHPPPKLQTGQDKSRRKSSRRPEKPRGESNWKGLKGMFTAKHSRE